MGVVRADGVQELRIMQAIRDMAGLEFPMNSRPKGRCEKGYNGDIL